MNVTSMLLPDTQRIDVAVQRNLAALAVGSVDLWETPEAKRYLVLWCRPSRRPGAGPELEYGVHLARVPRHRVQEVQLEHGTYGLDKRAALVKFAARVVHYAEARFDAPAPAA